MHMASSPLAAIAHDPKLQAVMAHFGEADCCWFSSVRPDGRAHLAPIWHVWQDDHLYVVTQAASVRATNIRTYAHVSLALPDPMNPIIVEGVAHPAPERRHALQPAFQRKYNWDIGSDPAYDEVIEITPRKVMAWGSHGEGRWTLAAQAGPQTDLADSGG